MQVWAFMLKVSPGRIMSNLIALSGRGSTISQNIFPRQELNEDAQYVMGLISFTTYTSIPNVHGGINLLHYSLVSEPSILKSIEIPVGSYEIDDLDKFIRNSI